ncbi:hypothetical protein CON13_29010 [Bacillus cereus]|uniref:hypothetical protein n=1 Tax=Bacillus cereus TaxID=1396 RepID=UPI000BEC12C6|nr:hypothetical protein [Bacillus cereus]PED28703.1 hypothetical protein CON13_29010 [Bacillus cereus]
MSAIIEFINLHGLNIIRYGLPILISSAAFTLSFIVYKQNKKRLDVTFEDSLEKIDDISTNVGLISHANGIIVCYLKVVNPSPSDIGYFDLRIFDSENPNLTLLPYTEKVLKNHTPSATSFEYETQYGYANLNAPKSNYGIFKSNSFTRLDIAFSPEQNTKEVTITFKVAIESRKKNPFASDRKDFKYYSKTYIIDKTFAS